MSVVAAIDSFNDLTEVINEMGTPDKVSVDEPSVVAAPPAVKKKTSTTPPPAPTKVPKATVSKVVGRKPPVVKDKPSEVVTSKPGKAVVSRLSLSARSSSAAAAKPVEAKPKAFLTRLPRAVHATLFAYFPLESLKNFSLVNAETFNMVNAHYTYWIRASADPTTQTLLADAEAKIHEKREHTRQTLRHAGDATQLIKVEDLRVLRTYRNPPPAVLNLSKAIVHLMRFAPPKGGVDARALAGDWGVMKNQFLDLKCIVKALKASSDAILHGHPLPFSKTHLNDIVSLVSTPDLEEVKFKRTCASLVPTLGLTRKIIACLNVDLRAVELTVYAKRHARDATEADIQEIVAKLEASAPPQQPEASPLPSPTGSSDKPKRTVGKTTVALRAKPVVPKVETKPAVEKTTALSSSSSIRKITPRAAKTATDETPSTTAKNSNAIVKSEEKVKRTPLSTRTPPTRTTTPPSAAALTKKSSLTSTDGKELKKTASTTSTSSMATLRAELDKANKDLESQTAALEDKAAQIASLASANAALDSELKRVQAELADVKVQWTLSREEAQAQQASLLEIKCVQESLQFRVNEMTQVEASRLATIDALTAEKQQLTEALHVAEAHAAQSAADKQSESDAFAERERQLRESLQASAAKEQEALVEQLRQLKEEIATLRSEHELELQNKQLRLDQVMGEKAQLGAALDHRNRFVTAVQQEKAKLVASLQAAQAQTFSLHETVHELQDELEKERRRVAAVELAYEESVRWQLAHQKSADNETTAP
ncbi:hypothetical protein LEN26_014854 [Aphanomyces euteiches]|nr:hypothetical protein LEN26_014854 [Aphanomyces euteiches]KAH9108542.1 hypothetical protein AeMF1_016294 [Aphanomyces euteiches]